MVEIDIDAVKTLYNATVAKLNALMADPDKAKVSYNVDGKKVDWTAYQNFLANSLERYAKQIERYEEPWEFEQQIIS